MVARNPNLGAEYKFVLKDSPNFIGIAKGEDKLRAKVNEIISAAKAAGDLDKLAQRWLPPALGRVWPAMVSQIVIVMLGSAVCGQIAALLGMALLLARLAQVPGAQRGVAAYVQLFQGTPLLMQLFVAYFGLALFGIQVSAWVAGGVALTLYASAF